MHGTSSRSLVLGFVLAMLVPAVTAADPPSWPNENPSADAKVRHTFVWIPAGDHRIPGILALPKAGGAARSPK